jgi:hypothetical protein
MLMVVPIDLERLRSGWFLGGLLSVSRFRHLER